MSQILSFNEEFQIKLENGVRLTNPNTQILDNHCDLTLVVQVTNHKRSYRGHADHVAAYEVCKILEKMLVKEFVK